MTEPTKTVPRMPKSQKPGQFWARCWLAHRATGRHDNYGRPGYTRLPEPCFDVWEDRADGQLDLFGDPVPGPQRVAFERHMAEVHNLRPKTPTAPVKPRKSSVPRQAEWTPSPADPGTAITFDGDRTGVVWDFAYGNGRWVIPDESRQGERMVRVRQSSGIWHSSQTWTVDASRLFARRVSVILSAPVREAQEVHSRPVVHIAGCPELKAFEATVAESRALNRLHRSVGLVDRGVILRELAESSHRRTWCPVCIDGVRSTPEKIA